jgi:hypothetical protein
VALDVLDALAAIHPDTDRLEALEQKKSEGAHGSRTADRAVGVAGRRARCPETFNYGTFRPCPVPLGPQHRPRIRRGAQEKERT